MKLTLILLTVFGLQVAAPAADKDDKTPDRKERRDKKDDKKGDKKEEVRNSFEVTVAGAKDGEAEADVKTFLSSIEGVKVESCEKTEKGIEAVLSSREKLSRTDVAKALKDNKDLKVSEFKAVRPGREKDGKKKEDGKDKKEAKKDPEKETADEKK